MKLQKQKYREGGESTEHKMFKEFVANNPDKLGLEPYIGIGYTEYALPSADKIDILFKDEKLKIGVEVKSIISDTADILRGMFQCVKYKYLIEAEQAINDEFPNSRIILALQGRLPKELMLVKNLLKIEVIENIK